MYGQTHISSITSAPPPAPPWPFELKRAVKKFSLSVGLRLVMSCGNGLGDGLPPSACRPVCLFLRTFLVLASLVGYFGCVLSFQGPVVGRNAGPSLQFGFFDHVLFVGLELVSVSAMKENACFSFWLLAACFAAMLGRVWCGLTLVVSCPRFGFQPLHAQPLAVAMLKLLAFVGVFVFSIVVRTLTWPCSLHPKYRRKPKFFLARFEVCELFFPFATSRSNSVCQWLRQLELLLLRWMWACSGTSLCSSWFLRVGVSCSFVDAWLARGGLLCSCWFLRVGVSGICVSRFLRIGGWRSAASGCGSAASGSCKGSVTRP